MEGAFLLATPSLERLLHGNDRWAGA